ncbi:MAG: AraC family transcriptional regulator [Verrucomicrobiota bacterium]
MKTQSLANLNELPPWERRALGKETKEWVIRKANCLAMVPHGLHDISHTRAGSMYHGVRGKWPLFMIIVSSAGAGRVRIAGGEWILRAGEALLIPPGLPHDMAAMEGGWVFSILNYDPGLWTGMMPSAPRSLPIHAQPLDALIEAFYLEYHADRDPVLLRQLTDIIHTKVLRLSNPDQTAGRLWPIWQRVLEEPDFAWNLGSLACLAHLSEEHLRRISRAEVGRSPMEQVTWLRLQEAARLLLSENHLIEDVAHRVGFESERAFRAAFNRAFDCAPSVYRQQGRETFTRLDVKKQAYSSPVVQRTAGSDWVRHVRRWHALDLSKVANARFSIGDRPWMNGDTPLLGIRPGSKKIHGVPFEILDETKGPSVLMLRSRRCTLDDHGQELPERVRLPVGRSIRGACFLHACGWVQTPGPFASYIFSGAEGERSTLELFALGTAHPEESDGRAANIQDWYFGYDPLDRGDMRPYLVPSSREPGAMSQYFYTLVWHNPKPREKIDFLEVASRPEMDTTLAVVAVVLF